MKTFYITVPEEDAEIAADRLWQLGVEAVGLDDPKMGVVELWTSVGDSPAALERAVASLQPGWKWRSEEAVEPAETWRDHVTASWYDPLGVVVPAWQADALNVADDVLVTAIEPASSFGLGDHPTTTLTLGLLAAHLRAVSVSGVLDVGCGSGVLGVVAAQMGVASIRSIDISSGAREATVANALLNGVEGSVEVDNAPLNEISGTFDLVLANILAPTLISLADHLKRATRPGGTLIISGILADSHRHVLDALQPLQAAQLASQDGWIAIALGAP